MILDDGPPGYEQVVNPDRCQPGGSGYAARSLTLVTLNGRVGADADITVFDPASRFAALVVTQTVGGDGQIVLDARLAGVGAAAAAIAARAPLPLVVVVAAAATALVRLLT